MAAKDHQDQEKIIEINGVKYSIRYEIRCKYEPKIKDLLKQNELPFEILPFISQIEDEAEVDDNPFYVPIEEELSNKLCQISKITGIPVKEMVDNELGGLLTDHARENPIIFLDSYLGIKNIKDPLAIVKKLQPILNIPDDWIKELESMDPVDVVKKYNNPLKYK